jgi:hypothetical protein
MAHVRQQIREALATLLIGLPTTASRVYKSRSVALQQNELPAIIVSTGSEEIEPMDIHGIHLQRTLQINIVLKAEVNTNIDNKLDQMALEVESRINANDANKTLGGLCNSITLNGIDMQFDEDLQQPLGEAVCRFETVYHTSSSDPETSLS